MILRMRSPRTAPARVFEDIVRDIASNDPIGVGQVAHFLNQLGRHTNPAESGHAWGVVSRGDECLSGMILHMTDLPEAGSHIV